MSAVANGSCANDTRPLSERLNRECTCITLDREALYWHYPHYQLYQQGGTTPYGAIRAAAPRTSSSVIMAWSPGTVDAA